MFGLIPFTGRNNLSRTPERVHPLFDFFNDPFWHDDFMSFNMPSSFKVDVEDKGDAYELTADLPGVKKEEIALKYEDNYLTIATNRNEANDAQDTKGNFIRRERRTGSVSRSFYVGEIDENKIAAEFTDGVLKVSLPKASEVQRAKEIPIR